MIYKYFLPICGWPFHFLNDALLRGQILTFMKPNLPNFFFCESCFQCHIKNLCLGNSLAVQSLGRGAFTAVAWVQSLVGELRSCKLHNVPPKKNLCLTQDHKDFILFSSRSFITLALTPLYLRVDFCVRCEVRV